MKAREVYDKYIKNETNVCLILKDKSKYFGKIIGYDDFHIILSKDKPPHEEILVAILQIDIISPTAKYAQGG